MPACVGLWVPPRVWVCGHTRPGLRAPTPPPHHHHHPCRYGEHPEWVDNLYFAYVVLLRAVRKSSQLLTVHDLGTGVTDNEVRGAVSAPGAGVCLRMFMLVIPPRPPPWPLPAARMCEAVHALVACDVLALGRK